MRRNMADWDRVLRALVGIALIALGATGAVGRSLGIVCIVAGLLQLVSGLTGFCPVYTVLRIPTKKT